MKITVEALVNADPDATWDAWNDPRAIMQWNAASDDWHTTRATVHLREGGTFTARMEAKDGSVGFDFTGTYTLVVPHERIEYRLDDGREVTVEFVARNGGTLVRESFDPDGEVEPEMQRQGWQAILDNFARYVGGAA